LLFTAFLVEDPAMNDPIAVRVARRHQAAVAPPDVPTTRRIEFASGKIAAVELKRMIESEVAALRWLVFRPSSSGATTKIRWEALAVKAELVSGKLILRTAVTDNEVRCWAEVKVDREP
jgi:hypothetical protein